MMQKGRQHTVAGQYRERLMTLADEVAKVDQEHPHERFDKGADASNATDFECPLCKSNQFTSVRLRRMDGTEFQASFFRCSHCDFGFTDLSMFRRKTST